MRSGFAALALLWLLLACGAAGDDLGGLEEAALRAFTRFRAIKAAASAAVASIAVSSDAPRSSALRVHFHFSIEPQDFGVLQHATLLQKANEAATYTSHLLQVRSPVLGNLLLTQAEAAEVNRMFRSRGASITVPDAYVAGRGTGAPADIIVLVHDASEVGWSCDASNGFLPAAGSTVLWFEPASGRTNLALLVVCPGMFEPHRVDSAFGVILHELIHVLGFTNALLRRMLPAAQFYQGSNAYGRPAWFVASPRVLGWARQQFACSALAAVPLEDEGGSGTVASHWEQTLFADDLMVGLNNRALGVTNLTLALMEDLGWYLPNYGLAAPSPWGAKAGCDFALSTCTTYMQRNPSQIFWCPSANNRDTVCTSSGSGGGACMSIVTSNGCVFVYPFFICRIGLQSMAPNAAGDDTTGMCLHTRSNPNRPPDYAGCFNVRCGNATTSFVNNARCQPGQNVQAIPVLPSPSLDRATITCPLPQQCVIATCANCTLPAIANIGCSASGGTGCGGSTGSSSPSPSTQPSASPSRFHTTGGRRKRRLLAQL